jgi:hypothetical protein
MSYYLWRNNHICAKSYSPYNCTTVIPCYKFQVLQGIRLCSIFLMTDYRSASNSAGHFPEYLRSDTFKKKSRCLLNVFKYLVALLYNIKFYEHLILNYNTVLNLATEVTMQVDRAAQVTHGEVTVTENLRKIFPNSKCVICQCPILLESHIFLNTRFFRLRH